MKKNLIYLFVFCCCLMSGCQQDDDAIVPQAMDQELLDYERSLEGITGTRLASVKLEDEHFMSFWEVAPGVVIVHEAHAASDRDFRQVDVVRMLNDGKSYADIYQSLTERTNDNYLKALTNADVRVKAYADLRRNDPASPVSVYQDEVPAIENGRTSAAGCGDLLQDNYGAQWFASKFYAPAPHRVLVTNKPSASFSGRVKWLTVVGMEADFNDNASARFVVSRLVATTYLPGFSPYYWPTTVYDVTVKTRWWQKFVLPGDHYAVGITGSSPCGARVHFTAMWDQ
jgi:hypothetical protein